MFTRNPWKLRIDANGDYLTRNGLIRVHRDALTGTSCVYVRDTAGDVPVSVPFGADVSPASVQAAVLRAVTPSGRTLFRVQL
jgi:hypothetical protein